MAWRIATYRVLRPLLFIPDPETVHDAALRVLSLAARPPAASRLLAFASGAPPRTDASPAEVIGLRFRNRIGLAAGFDKDALALPAWAALGFGFAEVGTVTPLPQAGRERPRLFRLPADEALINRMGFNNAGAETVRQRVADVRARLPPGFVVGVNIGRGRETPPEDAIDDYLAAFRAVASVADYVTINVSSPNTPQLRGLQDPARLAPLLDRLAAESDDAPLVVKLAPDLPPTALDSLLAMLIDSPVRGVIASNTSVERRGLRSPGRLTTESGGLSGAPLREQMLSRVSRIRQRAGDRLAIIASGGITSAADGFRAREAGADLVQVWTGLIYHGPGLIGELVRGDH